MSRPPAAPDPGESPDLRLTGVLAVDPGLLEAAGALAADLGVPLLSSPPAARLVAQPLVAQAQVQVAGADEGLPEAVLAWTRDGLELRSPMGTIRVDYQAGREAVRVLRGSGRREPLSRALGLAAKQPTRSVLDATAGLGRDAFLLASLGIEVLAVERNPVVGALVRDALTRATGPDMAQTLLRLDYRLGDARTVLDGLSPADAPDAIYLDPMFPPRRKSALVKKEMRILAALVGGTTPDADVRAVLDAALDIAVRRVVVKRPADAPPIDASRAPDHAVTGGRTTRYDVWMT